MADPTQAYPVATLNNVDTDAQWEKLTGAIAASGVDAGDGPGALAVTLNSSTRSAVVAPGGAFLQGRYRPAQASAESVAIPAASSQDRYDRVVMRLNRGASLLGDVVKPVIITGTPANSPSKPAILNNATLYDVPLASYRAAANGTLTELVDERRFIGLASRAAPIGIGVPAATPVGSLWWASDGGAAGNGRLLVKQLADGTHIPVAEDSGWVTLNTFGTALYEAVTSSPPAIRAKNGFGCLAGAVVRTDNDLAAGDDNSPILQIPAAYMPSRQWTSDAVSGASSRVAYRLVIDASSRWLFLTENSAVLNHKTGSDQSTGTFIYLSQVNPWPIG